MKDSGCIIDMYGISQNPDTKEYIIIFKYASFNDWIITNYEGFNWEHRIKLLYNIAYGLKEIHQNQMVHHNFHTGNILIQNQNLSYISVDDIDQTQVYGVMPYVS